jgi:divalent metal cation (Fe/Co/Zn/Cd) transporter
MQRVKKIVPLTLLAFVVYAIVKSPSQAADLVHTLWDIIFQGFTGIGSFFDAVLNRK